MKPIYETIRHSLGYRFPPLGSTANRLFFKLVPDQIHAEIFPGISVPLDFNDTTQRTTYWQGDRFEYPTIPILSKWASAGATHFFDIGANYGFFSYFMLSKFREITVHAFEPNPATFRLTERIKSTNQLSRFHPHPIGFSDSNQTLKLHPGTSDSGHSTFGEHPELCDNSTEEIPVERFDSWRQRAGISIPDAPAWIAKIDVEGFEPKVLAGMVEALQARAFIGLVVEVNPYTLQFCSSTIEAIYTPLISAGYEPANLKNEVGASYNEFFTIAPSGASRPS